MNVCASCGAATRPDDRFCASCGTRLEHRCATCGTTLPDEARFCPSCGTSVATPEESADDRSSGEERKVVSVLFADLVGFTASSDGADPEDVRQRLRPYHEALREDVERFGGRIEKLMGDGVLAVFGAPTVHEDDPERAVRAALRIQESVEGMSGSTGMRARVAVGTGEAVVLVDGTTMDREGLVGDVVNTASRLQGEAPPGAVLVDEATHRATHRVIVYEERPPVAVKGKTDPLAVWMAMEPTGRFGSDVDDDGASFLGRTSELALVVDAFTRTSGDETSQIVTIVGEPGVGKSRLVRELRRHVDDLPDLTRWRQGRCLPYGEGIAYWALGEIAKAEAGIFETDPPATALAKLDASLEPLLADEDERAWVAGRLAPLVGSDQESPGSKEERFAAWHRFVGALGEQRPSVIVIEDLHWADPALVEFLADLPEATRDVPLLLVCTARPAFFEQHPGWGGGQRNALTVRLDPLDAAATEQLLTELLDGDGFDDETRRAIVERSGGNPLWAQEFVRMLHDRPAGDGDLAIPDTVQAVVASRIDLLDQETKTVIQAASIIGKSFWAGAVGALVEGDGGVDSALRELTRRELVRRERTSTVDGETQYAFTHSVVRDVAASQVPRSIRAGRHHRAARWVEGIGGERVSAMAEVVAYHDAEALRLAVASDLPEVDRYIEFAIGSHTRAAEFATGLDARAQQAHLEAALELVPAGDQQRGRLLVLLASAYGDLGSAEIGVKVLHEGRQILGDAGHHEEWGLASAQLSRLLWVLGEPDEAWGVLEEARDLLADHPPGPAMAAVFTNMAGSLWLRGASAEALEFIAGIRPIVEAHGDLESRQRLMSAEGGARFDLGDPGAIESFRQVLRVSLEADNTFWVTTAHLNLGEQLRTGWGPSEAIPVHVRGLELAVQRNIGGTEQFLRFALGDDYFSTGEWDEALHEVEAALAMPEGFSYLEGGLTGIRLAIAAARSGGDTELRSEAMRIVEESETLRDLQAVVPSYNAAQWVLLMAGDFGGAVEFAERIVERAGATRYLLDVLPLTVWLLKRAGRMEQIVGLLPDLRRYDMPRPRAGIASLEAFGMAESDPAGALAGLTASANALIGVGARLDAVLILAEAARIADDLDTDLASELRAQARGQMAGMRAETLTGVLGLS